MQHDDYYREVDLEDCPVCDGEGIVRGNFNDLTMCLECKGTGLLIHKKQNPFKKIETMTIHEIRRRTEETEPYFFSAKTLRFFGQKMSDFRVRQQADGRYYICAIMRDPNGNKVGLTQRYYNPITNKLEIT